MHSLLDPCLQKIITQTSHTHIHTHTHRHVRIMTDPPFGGTFDAVYVVVGIVPEREREGEEREKKKERGEK